MDGIVNLLKTAGMTSHDAVYFLRRLSGEKHIGHTGTLDPQASGVLTLCLGNATRFIEHMEGDTKSYRCEMMLGVVTETGDIWGGRIDGLDTDRVKAFRPEDRIIPEEGWPTEEAVRAAVKSLEGIRDQIPPTYSAVKVGGVALYKLARKGRELPEIAPRRVEITAADLIRYDAENGVLTVDLTCSKGTYVRSLVEDIGNELGTGAAMSGLIRTRAGAFTLDDCATIAELREDLAAHLLPPGSGLDHFGEIRLKPGRDEWFTHGGYLVRSDWTSFKEANPREKTLRHHNHERDVLYVANYKVLSADGVFLGSCVYDAEKKRYVPDKVLPLKK
ncbi:MAG: tRNA pseudouridine(55) synthase TruB [Firmicutes bacterium]|nr:tRNA pseudouridine(55) synthase TruB [Bacillota bacterium]